MCVRLSRGRAEAFSDGVFAIAATLLILEVRLPDNLHGDLLGALLRLWPSYAAYAASFTTIGIMWLNHHSLLVRVKSVDRPLLLLNLFLLMTISFLPFPTSVLGQNLRGGDQHIAAAFYAVTCLLIAVGFTSVYVYIGLHPNLIATGFRADDMVMKGPWFSVGLIAYAACIPLAFFSPILVLVIVTGAAIFYAFERLPGPRHAVTE
jgi:uncharacterized membrane protein